MPSRFGCFSWIVLVGLLCLVRGTSIPAFSLYCTRLSYQVQCSLDVRGRGPNLCRLFPGLKTSTLQLKCSSQKSNAHQRADVKASRVIIIGDVHGCKDELLSLLERCKYHEKNDKLVFVGDLIAKGPDSVGCLEIAKAAGALSVMGNHEDRVLALIQASIRSGKMPVSDCTIGRSAWHAGIAQSLLSRGDDLWRYIESLPLSLSIPSFNAIVVHAGLLPGTRVEDNSRRVLTKMRSVVRRGAAYEPSPSAQAGDAWAPLWTGPEIVVFGHDSARGLQVHPRAVGLDTGCVYGGKLTALVLPGRQIVSVPARRVYCAQHGPKAAPAPAPEVRQRQHRPPTPASGGGGGGTAEAKAAAAAGAAAPAVPAAKRRWRAWFSKKSGG